MKIKVPKEGAEKGITVREAIHIVKKTRGLFFSLSGIWQYYDFSEDGYLEKAKKAFLDVEDLETIYNQMVHQLINEMNLQKMKKEMSLLDYMVIYEGLETDFSIGDLRKRYLEMQEQYNLAIEAYGRPSFEKCGIIIKSAVKELQNNNDSFRKELGDTIAKPFNKQEKDMQKLYAQKLDTKIDFWKFLSDLPDTVYELSEGESIEFYTRNGDKA